MIKSPFDRGGLRYYLVGLVLIKCAISHLAFMQNLPPVAALLLKGEMTSLTFLAALPLVFIGTAIHFWAKGCLLQNAVVAVIGPYRYVRHPFYLGNILIDFSIAIMSGWWLLWVILPVWWFAIYIPVMRGEEQHLVSLFGNEYREYMKRLPRLFPCRMPLPSNGKGFFWSNHNIAQGMEFTRACRLLAYPVLLYVWNEAWKNLSGFFSDAYHLNLIALCGLVALYGLASEFRKHLKKGRMILPKLAHLSVVRVIFAVVLLTVAVLMHQLQTDYRAAMIPAGAFLLILSIVALTRRHMIALLVAEGLALMGVTFLCKMPWLAVAPLLYYAALVMDTRIALRESKISTQRATGDAWPVLYFVLLIAGPVGAAVKDIVLAHM